MPRRQDDDVAGGPDVPARRSLLTGAGFLLAAAATLAVFLTDNPQHLRVAVVAVAWAFVLATFAAGRRGGDRAAAAAREAQLRRTYEHELDLEVAARREYELELENELRRESEQGMREELDALRTELAALADLREQVAGVAALGSDIAALATLRDEVARVTAMREDLAALGSLRQELGQLNGLRDDMGRLRAELTEQLSSEMLIERIVMRTQASRVPGEPTRTLDAVWNDETPRELTGGWPAVRLDEPRETRQVEQVRVERADVRPSPQPRETHTSASWTPPAPPTTTFTGPQPSRLEPPPSPAGTAPGPAPADPPPTPPPSPLDWLVARELLDAPVAPPSREPSPEPPQTAPRRRRGDNAEAPAVPAAEARTTERPSPTPRTRIEDRGGYRVALPEVPPVPPAAVPPSPPPPPAASPATGDRLAEILAENGVSPAAGGRRRRRYREDDESDDVLSRVLGRD
ncbi:hypothetical protein DQ239_09135 [Blastococcus sp. TF02-09]|uniref:DUF6779 domain-containing protein n=1 Tax=Blastococcus sp. TF02-09 TaxID=2250576 RepID=UPI000E117398|nr:DUF6779 domain-containing protein [Blastococcus sp. TF02-9]RBY77879.1 hypothetical protein DQ239_09135 [Blastococcus sp. TF02-9]